MKDRRERRPHGTPAPATATEHWVVDAIEKTPDGPVARIERQDGSTFTLPADALPGGSREGDLLAVHDGPDGVQVRALPEATARRRHDAQQTLDHLNAATLPGTGTDGEITL